MAPPDFTRINARERSLWVQGELRRLGLSFAAIARAHGWNPVSVSQAMYTANDAQEKAIAAALGIGQEQLFPERYLQGKRLHVVLHNRRPKNAGNVKDGEAA